jgi:hypothetical protein
MSKHVTKKYGYNTYGVVNENGKGQAKLFTGHDAQQQAEREATRRTNTGKGDKKR